MAMFSRAILALVALTGVACETRLEDPEPPDTKPLEATYDNPPGMFTASDIKVFIAGFQERLQLLATTGNFGEAETLLNNASVNKDVVENGDQVDPSAGSRVRAVIKVTHVCRGPDGNGAVDPDLFGTIRMTIKGSLRGLYPTAWGEFDACSDHSPLGAFTMDGAYAITVRQRATGKDVLILFQGTITSEAVNFNGVLDVRVRSNGVPEVRITGLNGDVVLSADPSGKILAHDRTGVWSCDPLALECVNQTTGERRSAQ